MSKLTEKECQKLKDKFVTTLINHVCGEEDSLPQLLQYYKMVSLNKLSIQLFGLFLQAMSVEDYISAQKLKKEIVYFIDMRL